MASTVFTDFDTSTGTGTTIVSAWLNDINIAVYTALGAGGVAPTSAADIITNLDLPTLSAATNVFTGNATFGGTFGVTGAVTLSNSLSVGTSLAVTGASVFTGHLTIEGVTSTGATGTGKFVFDASPALTGTPTSPTQAVLDNTTAIATDAFVNTELAALTPTITASTASNALTVGLTAPLLTYFRNSTLTTGGFTPAYISSNLTLTVPSGATLGTISAVQTDLVLLLAYNAGSPVLCIVNPSGYFNLDETTLISPTTISGTSNSYGVVYSASAVSANSPFRVLGYITITEATAGTWATNPTLIQGSLGEAATSLQSCGVGQSWQVFAVGTTRVSGITYYNQTSRPIQFSVSGAGSGGITSIQYYVGGVNIGQVGFGTGALGAGMSFIVPPGQSYSATISAGGGTIIWAELR